MLVAVNRISKSNPIVIAIINFAMKMHNYGKNFVFSRNFKNVHPFYPQCPYVLNCFTRP